jgi:thiol-disulfide isomerase/thioredoxin
MMGVVLFITAVLSCQVDASTAVAIALAQIEQQKPAPAPIPPPVVPARVCVWTASWCGPCKSLHPTIDALAAEGWDVGYTDADEYVTAREGWGIRAFPTIQIVRGDKEIGRRIGAYWSADELRGWFREAEVRRKTPGTKGP